MRDLVTSIAEGVVDRMRPDVRLGRVYSVDVSASYCEVEFVGDPQTTRVRFSPDRPPSSSVLDPHGEPNIVRVAGRAGQYYIIDYVTGTPNQLGSVPVTGTIPYFGDDEPLNWAKPVGQFISQADYPVAFSKLGHKANNGIDPGDGTFRLPDMRDKTMVGTSATKAAGSTGGAASKVIASANLPKHTHNMDHDHPNISGDGSHVHSMDQSTTDGAAPTMRRGASTINYTGSAPMTGGDGTHSHSVPARYKDTGDGGFANTALDIQNPYVACNWLMRLK